MDADDAVEQTLALQGNLQTFIDKVDELRNEDDPSGDGFTREFRVIREHGLRMKEENTYPAEEGKKSCNIKKNRYRDILPFDETRVILEEIADEEGSDYINANFIKNHNGDPAYIASQGPLAHTVNDFWRMIMQYNVKVVIMACQTVEMGRKKCEQYWPSDDAENKTEEFGDVTVTLVSEDEVAEDCVKRILRAVQGDNIQTLTQFHFLKWPDHDIPKDFDAIFEILAEMRFLRGKDLDKSPLLVHCSAGCGRTGTICAIDYSWEVLKTGSLTEDFSLYDIVMALREQRQSMIQAPEQYMMAHVIIQQLFQKHLEMMDDHTYGNVEFSQEDIGGDDASIISSEKSSPRKNSLLQQEIEVTLQKVSGDNLSLSETKSLTKEHGVPPISPIQEEIPKSPNVKNIASVFNVEKVENLRPSKETLKSQISTSDGKKKHVTTISIGGSAPKQPLSQTKSQPAVRVTNKAHADDINAGRPKTLPAHPVIKEKPQSSIPPTLPTQTYSYARNDQITNTTDSKAYSAISNYSSVKQTESDTPHSYHVLEKTREDTLKRNGTAKNVYSVAKEPEGDVYSSVVKPKMNGAPKVNGTSYDAVYEAIQVGETGPPSLPNRGYVEDEQVKPTIGGAADTLAKTKQLMSNFKNMFTKTQAGSDTSLPSEVPGYKEKIGSRPTGPRDPPWKKK